MFLQFSPQAWEIHGERLRVPAIFGAYDELSEMPRRTFAHVNSRFGFVTQLIVEAGLTRLANVHRLAPLMIPGVAAAHANRDDTSIPSACQRLIPTPQPASAGAARGA